MENEIDFKKLMSRSDRKGSINTDIKNLLNIEHMDFLVKTFLENRTDKDLSTPAVLKLNMDNPALEGAFILPFEEYPTKKAMSDLRRFLKHNWEKSETDGVRVYFSGGTRFNPDQIRFKDLSHIPDPSKAPTNAINQRKENLEEKQDKKTSKPKKKNKKK